MTCLAFLHFGDEPLWVYLSIPPAAALVGYLTKILAVKMIFHPIEFKGIRPWLGWQGQIPKRAAKMAGIAVDSVTSGLMKPEELFDRIDPDELAKELEGPLHEATAEIVDAIMLEYQPRLWNTMPDVAKRAVIANVERRAPEATRNMMAQLRANLDQVFDIKHMVVSNLVRDKVALNRMFANLGEDAFKFIIRSGVYFGFYIGLVQVAVFGITGSHLVLPLFGLVTGGLTDYIALTMIFRPKEERTILPGIKWQGLFHNRREKATREYAKVLAKDILTPAAIMESLLTGPMSDKFFEMLQDEIQTTIDQQAGIAGRVVSLAVGGRQYQEMKQTVAQRVIEKLPEQSEYVEAYAAERLDIENTISERMQMMDSDTYENLLRPAFKDDEWIVVALGATLGFLFGEVQVQIITALA
jgi:uncharacterized membrane protein YheB (UPF0754 family)